MESHCLSIFASEYGGIYEILFRISYNYFYEVLTAGSPCVQIFKSRHSECNNCNRKVLILAKLGFNAYRFLICWYHIFPGMFHYLRILNVFLPQFDFDQVSFT